LDATLSTTYTVDWFDNNPSVALGMLNCDYCDRNCQCLYLNVMLNNQNIRISAGCTFSQKKVAVDD